MTQEKLNALCRELAEQLAALKIPVSNKIAPEVRVNSRAKRRLGCCYAQDGGYVIEVSAGLLEDRERLRQTLVHELLHTCPGCRNHGERWKSYARRVNEAWGMEIRRLAPAEGPTEPLRREKVKYILQCTRCGREFPRSRMSKAVKYPGRYRCPCGGALRRVR